MATIVENNNNKNENTTIPLTKIQEEFFTAIENGDIKTVEKILSSKDSTSSVPANFQNPNNGTSGLMLAAKFGQHEIVSVLIQHGAPWNALDQYGESAGDYALKVNNQKMVNQLVNIGVQAELLFAALDANKVANKTQVPKAKEKIFIERNVRYEGNALLDDENRGVMMQWEEPLMEAHAQLLCQSKGDVLNIGFGMGYIDTAIQKYPVKSHTIIEAHPQVYKKMIADGWDKKPNVKIVFGRWQDVIDTVGTFDSVYFDTFDDVGHLREFHQHLPKLVRPGGMYSFFNGISDNVFFLGVACECIKIELTQMNFTQIDFYPVDIDVSDEEIWKDTSFRYFNSNQYYLPVCIKG